MSKTIGVRTAGDGVLGVVKGYGTPKSAKGVHCAIVSGIPTVIIEPNAFSYSKSDSEGYEQLNLKAAAPNVVGGIVPYNSVAETQSVKLAKITNTDYCGLGFDPNSFGVDSGSASYAAQTLTFKGYETVPLIATNGTMDLDSDESYLRVIHSNGTQVIGGQACFLRTSGASTGSLLTTNLSTSNLPVPNRNFTGIAYWVADQDTELPVSGDVDKTTMVRCWPTISDGKLCIALASAVQPGINYHLFIKF